MGQSEPAKRVRLRQGLLVGILRYNPEMKIAGPVLVCLLSAMFALASCGDGEQPLADAVEWGYDGPGAPENWASLSEEYATCANGQQQSPVDITGYEETDAEPISFLYDSDAAAVRNDGRFVHIDYAPGSMLSVGKQIFELKSAHLHSPSEHWIDGVSFAAELHLVHAAPTVAWRRWRFCSDWARPAPRWKRYSTLPRLPAVPSAPALHSTPAVSRRTNSAIISTTARRRHPRARSRLPGL